MFENIKKMGTVMLEIVPWPILQSVITFDFYLLSFVIDLSSYFFGGFLLMPIIGLCMLVNNINFGRKYRQIYPTMFTSVQIFPDYFTSWILPFMLLALYQNLTSLFIYGFLSVFVILYCHQHLKSIAEPEIEDPFESEHLDPVVEFLQDEVRKTIAKEIARRFHDILEQKVIMDLESYHIEADNNMDVDKNEAFTNMCLSTKRHLVKSISSTTEAMIEQCCEGILSNYLLRHVSEDNQSVTSDDSKSLSEMSAPLELEILAESVNAQADLVQRECDMEVKSIYIARQSKSMPFLSSSGETSKENLYVKPATFKTSYRTRRYTSANQLLVLRPGLLVASARKSRPHCSETWKK